MNIADEFIHKMGFPISSFIQIEKSRKKKRVLGQGIKEA